MTFAEVREEQGGGEKEKTLGLLLKKLRSVHCGLRRLLFLAASGCAASLQPRNSLRARKVAVSARDGELKAICVG